MRIYVSVFLTILSYTLGISQDLQKDKYTRGNGYEIIDYLWERSHAILQVKVLSIKTGLMSDDMSNFFMIHAMTEERFKTDSIHKDSTSIHFEEKVSWKIDDLNVKTKLDVGKSYIIFVYMPSVGEYLTEKGRHTKCYLLIDNILGIQEKNEKMIGYLEGRRYSEIKK